ncbi:MAG: glycosyltransferase family 39 protein [Chloroflexi bacterium]|nr:glycosyltransferase family 39 protein [Chloroflexota bacterium]
MLNVSTREKLILVGILALAACLRFYRLDTLPPGFQFDQAFYMFDVLRILEGEFHIFFTQPGGSEPLFVYLATAPAALVGVETPLAIKITAGIIGILTVGVVFGVARTLFNSTRIGLLSALFTAISFWHIFYNRYGERIPLTVLLATVTLWQFWRALTRARWRDFALTGIFTGLTLYTYPSARIVPVAIVLLTAYAMLAERARARVYFVGLVLAGAVAAIVFAPLGWHYIERPIDFFSHTTEVSIFVPHGTVSDNALLELAKNAVKIAGMFFVVGDPGVLRNLPYRPVFDPFAAILFVIGVIAWLRDFFAPQARRRAIFLAVWLGLAIALSLVSDDAPNNGRIMVGSPVILMLPAWGASALWDRLRAPIARRAAALAFGAIVLISATLTTNDYFVVFTNSPDTYLAFDMDKVETAQWINRAASETQLYLAPLWHQNGTISFLTRYAAVTSFESRDTVVIPSNASGKDALYAFPPEQERKVQTLATRLGALGARETLPASNGGALLLLYRVPASNLPDARDPFATLARAGDFARPQTRANANWGNLIELIGHTVLPEGPGGRNLTVTLFLRALNPIPDQYTFSIKVRDEKNRTWGQEDKWAGTNSYATTQWRTGEIIIEKFYPGLNACAPAGIYRVAVEAYNPRTMQVLGEPIALGNLNAGASEGNRYEDLEPEQTLDVQIAPQARLMGWTLTPNELRAGDTFALSLFWRGAGDGKQAQRAVIRLRDAALRDFVLADKTVTIPVEGRGLCAFFDLQLANAAPGQATLFVNEVKVGNLQVTGK